MAKVIIDGVTFSKKNDAICFFLETQGMKAKDVAKKVGCSEALVSQAKKNIKPADRKKIAKQYTAVNKAPKITDLMASCTKKASTKKPKAKKVTPSPTKPIAKKKAVEAPKVVKSTSAREEAKKALKQAPTKPQTKAEVTPKPTRKRKAKKVVKTIKTVDAVKVNVNRGSEITKYVIGYAHSDRQLSFKDMETHDSLTQEQFIESAQTLLREYSSKYVYLNCHYADGSQWTEVVYRGHKNGKMTMNNIWN